MLWYCVEHNHTMTKNDCFCFFLLRLEFQHFSVSTEISVVYLCSEVPIYVAESCFIHHPLILPAIFMVLHGGFPCYDPFNFCTLF